MTRLATRWLLGIGLRMLAVVALLPGPAAAQSADEGAWPARVGRLVEVQGVVWLFDRDEGQWTQVQHNRPLTTGDRLSTERGARAELRIGSTTLRVDGDTDLSLPRLDDQAIAVELSTGSLALRVTAREVLSQIEVATAEGRFNPRATGHYRIDRRGEASEATAWRGSLQFESHDSRLTITGGQHAELWQQGPERTTHYRLVPVERDEFAAWVARDDRDLDRTEALRHVPAEMTGWEDLDRYGRWRSHPEFGSVWMPSDVPDGWVPYQDGRWTWVSPWGWTWVDAAPWGFAPFHYGRWVRWGGRWVWSPGPRTHRPVFAPALVTWTFAPHHPDGRRPPPPSGWTPLAPHEVYRPHRPVVLPRPPHDRVVPPAPWRGERLERGDRGDRRPDPRPSPPRPAPPRPDAGIEPARPVPYTPQGVPGGVTVVPRDVFAAPGTAPASPQPPRTRPERPDRVERVDRPDRPERRDPDADRRPPNPRPPVMGTGTPPTVAPVPPIAVPAPPAAPSPAAVTSPRPVPPFGARQLPQGAPQQPPQTHPAAPLAPNAAVRPAPAPAPAVVARPPQPVQSPPAPPRTDPAPRGPRDDDRDERRRTPDQPGRGRPDRPMVQ